MITSALNKDREAKYLISGATNVFGTAAYTYSSVVDVPQGTGDSARIGDVLEPARLHFVIHLVRNPATSNVDEVIRIVIFQWRPQFSLQPPTSAVFGKMIQSLQQLLPSQSGSKMHVLPSLFCTIAGLL